MQKYLQQRSVCQIITTVIFTTSSVLKTKHLRFSRSMIKKLVLKHHIFQKTRLWLLLLLLLRFSGLLTILDFTNYKPLRDANFHQSG